MERYLAGAREWTRRLLGLVRGAQAERDLQEELASHLEMAEEELRERGESPESAARLARVRFGRSGPAMEALREQRGLPLVDSLWLDLRLGLRLLRRSWGLTLAGGLAMTVAFVIAAVVSIFLDDLMGRSAPPLEEGDRLVALQTWDPVAHRRRDTAFEDIERWRERLRLVEGLGGFQTIERRLSVGDGPGEWVRIAEMSASGFRLARVAPLLGRSLVEADQRADAPPVVVIGHDAWRSRFASDVGILGRTVRIGDTLHTVVGVMPEGFAFPLNHRYWVPLNTDRPGGLRHAPDGVVFGKLAPGVSLEDARGELATVGLLPAVATDAALQQRRPRVVPYTFAFTDDVEQGELAWRQRLVLLLVTLLLVPPCANVAILVYARTVARQAEFTARYALGASRGRMVGQIFIEVLVLAAVAAGAALLLARPVLGELGAILSQHPELGDGTLPFWVDFGLSSRTAIFVGGLALLAALIAGLVPALQATRRMMPSGSRASGGGSGLPLGAVWTTLVVAQVALALAALPSAVELAWGNLRPAVLGPGFDAGQFLTARLLLEPDAEVGLAERGLAPDRLGSLREELVRRLQADSVVSGVTLTAALPGGEPLRAIEIDDGARGARRISRFAFGVNRVDDAFFDVLDIPLLAGGGFGAGDAGASRNAAVVSQTFVEQVLGTDNALGRRIRTAVARQVEPGPWYEIVGVVPDRPANTSYGRIYLRVDPTLPSEDAPGNLVVRAGPNVSEATGRLMELAEGLDPALRVAEARSLDEFYREQQTVSNLPALILGAVTLSVILLSAAGLYALMSFTVARRRHEIGIRSALGAQAPRLLAGVLRRSLLQISAGAAIGVAMAILLHRALNIGPVGGAHIPGVLPAAVALMVAVGVLAAVGPARRALRVDPTQALRDEG